MAEGNPSMMECAEAGLQINRPRIIVHGGMYSGIYYNEEKYMNALKDAAKEGYKILRENGTAVEAVKKAVFKMEESKQFNAGHGSFFNAIGKVECDAMIMDGYTLKSGAVAAVRYIPHPVSLSAEVMNSEHCLLGGPGALEFAIKRGFQLVEVEGRPVLEEAINSDTVSAIAMDNEGHLACATSSGGIPRKREGRIGDASLVGCGGYANRSGAATASGHGELIIRTTVAREVVYNIEKQNQDAQEAAENALNEIGLKLNQCDDDISEPYHIGAIAIDDKGNFGIATLDTDPIPWVRISGNKMEYGVKPGEPDGEEFISIEN